MQRSRNKISGLLMGIALMVISYPGWATLTVTQKRSHPQYVVISLNPPVLSAGVDVPVGTVLYQASVIMSDIFAETTWETADIGKYLYYSTSLNLIVTPMSLSGLTTGPYANGVYQTGIPGIGLAMINGESNRAITTSKIYSEEQHLLDSSLALRIIGKGASPPRSPRGVVLVKTGPIVPGSYTVGPGNSPTAEEVMEVSQNSHTNAVTISGLPFYYLRFSFQGKVTISAPTCTTPDVSVNLGSYEIGEHFRGLNSTTPWKDASIALTNCSTFYGFYNSTNSPLILDYNTLRKTSTSSLNNSVGVRLTPITKALDAANGVMAIDSTVSGAASGVGIQLGWGESTQAPTLFNFSEEQSLALPKDGSPTIRIPLAARYIKTATTPTPGRANGKVTFTINYY